MNWHKLEALRLDLADLASRLQNYTDGDEYGQVLFSLVMDAIAAIDEIRDCYDNGYFHHLLYTMEHYLESEGTDGNTDSPTETGS